MNDEPCLECGAYWHCEHRQKRTQERFNKVQLRMLRQVYQDLRANAADPEAVDRFYAESGLADKILEDEEGS